MDPFQLGLAVGVGVLIAVCLAGWAGWAVRGRVASVTARLVETIDGIQAARIASLEAEVERLNTAARDADRDYAKKVKAHELARDGDPDGALRVLFDTGGGEGGEADPTGGPSA